MSLKQGFEDNLTEKSRIVERLEAYGTRNHLINEAAEYIESLHQQLAEQAEAIDLQLHTNRRIVELEQQLSEAHKRALYAKTQIFLGYQSLDGPVPGLKPADDCGIRYVE